MAPSKSLFERLGGESALTAVVDELYKTLQADKRVSKFFASTDMNKLKKHQRAFLTVAFGGPKAYTGRELRPVHAGLGITDAEFGAVAEDLQKVLKTVGVDAKLIKEVMTIVGSVKDDIVTKSLFDRLGGEGAISAVVEQFYKTLQMDKRVSKFFAKTDMDKLKKHQKAFLTVAFGGPNAYKGKELRPVHAGLGITDADFDVVAEDLVATLKGVGVDDKLIGEVVAIVSSVKGDIVVKPLFDRLGGEGAISVVVEEFYKGLLADSRVSKFFSATDMDKLKRHQKAFLTVAFGGPNAYKGKELRPVHSGLGITDADFGAVAEVLVNTLKSVGVAQNLIDEVVAIVGSVKGDIVMNPLYDRIGGAEAVGAVVEEFYKKLLADARVRDYFSRADMAKLRSHQVAFLTTAFGGPSEYSGRELKKAHADLGITEEAFGAVAEILVAVLQSLSVTQPMIDEIVAIVGSVKGDIVEQRPLFVRLGGEGAISAVVDEFYKTLLADNRVSGFFESKNMEQLKQHQKAFLTLAFGGPKMYTGRELRPVHASLGITGVDFDTVAEDLVKVLNSVGVAQNLIDEVVGIVGSVKTDIVTQPLFVQLGGDAAISAVVDDFYAALIADPQTLPFYTGIDISKVKQHQKAFLTVAFGGPSVYTGRAISAVHADKNIKNADFQRVADILVKVLKKHSVEHSLIDEVVTIVGSVQSDVVGAVMDASAATSCGKGLTCCM